MQTSDPQLLHVRRSGNGQPLVLLHGVAGSGAIWDELAHELETHYDVIRLDLLGYGYSPKPDARYGVATHLAAIHYTIRQLGLAEPPVMVGLSMGSLLALSYAARYPTGTKAAICIGLPYYASEAEARERLAGSFWTGLVLSQPRLARLLISLVWPLGRTRPAGWLAARLRPHNALYKGEAGREALMATYRSFSSSLQQCLLRFRLEPDLARVSAPVLLIHGSRDRWTPAKTVSEVARRLPNARLITIPDQPHNLVSFAPGALAPLVDAFVRELGRDQPRA